MLALLDEEWSFARALWLQQSAPPQQSVAIAQIANHKVWEGLAKELANSGRQQRKIALAWNPRPKPGQLVAPRPGCCEGLQIMLHMEETLIFGMCVRCVA